MATILTCEHLCFCYLWVTCERNHGILGGTTLKTITAKIYLVLCIVLSSKETNWATPKYKVRSHGLHEISLIRNLAYWNYWKLLSWLLNLLQRFFFLTGQQVATASFICLPPLYCVDFFTSCHLSLSLSFFFIQLLADCRMESWALTLGTTGPCIVLTFSEDVIITDLISSRWKKVIIQRSGARLMLGLLILIPKSLADD